MCRMSPSMYDDRVKWFITSLLTHTLTSTYPSAPANHLALLSFFPSLAPYQQQHHPLSQQVHCLIQLVFFHHHPNSKQQARSKQASSKKKKNKKTVPRFIQKIDVVRK